MLVAKKTQNQSASIVDYGLVSIIMPNYNSEKYIEATINSVLAQTYHNWELLFVDDCSSDASLELVKAFQDERIRIFSMKKKRRCCSGPKQGDRRSQRKMDRFLGQR